MRSKIALAGLAVICLAGCSFRLPTPEQRAALLDLGRETAALTADLDEIAVTIRTTIEAAAAGELSPEEAGACLSRLYERRAGLELRLAKVRSAGEDLRARGVNVLFIALSALGGVASALLGGKAHALKLVGLGLSRVLEKAKAGKYADGDTRAELAKAGASPALAEDLRRAAG